MSQLPNMNKETQNKEIQYKPIKNKIKIYKNNSNDKKIYSNSISSFSNLDLNTNEFYINNKNSIKKSFESNEQNDKNENNNIFDNNITEYNSEPYVNYDYFNNYKYYDPSSSIYNSLPLQKNNQNNELINSSYNNSKSSKVDYSKNNPNYFNQRKNKNLIKINKNNNIFNNMSSHNFLPKRTINKINSKYGELLNNNNQNDNNFYSFNNNFLNYLAESNYNEDSFSNEGVNEDNNNNINNGQVNKLTRYDIRKKKSMTDGQTFFIKKAENSNNYKFFESKNTKDNKINLIKNNLNNSNIKEDKIDDKINNKSESIYINQIGENENINNHNFIIIKSSSLDKEKVNNNNKKNKINNYQYREIKAKGPNNFKPVMKLRIGINGEKFYEKFIPENKVIKYTYEPVCKIIDNKNMNNIGFKKIESHNHLGSRKKYKKINPKYLITPAANVFISNDNYNYTGNVIENINDFTYNKENNNNEKKTQFKNIKNKKIKQQITIEKNKTKKE